MTAMPKTALHEGFCQSVRVWRKELGLTQADLAERLGVTQEAVSAIERGKGSPSLDSIEKVAAAMRLQVRIVFEPAAAKIAA